MPNAAPTPRLRTSAWCVAGPATESSLLECGAQIDEVNPCWYRLGIGIGDPLVRYPQGNAAGWIATRRAMGMKVVPTVQDVGKQPVADAIFKQPALRRQLLDGILTEVDTLDLDGIDVDFETAMNPALFSAFLTDLANELHGRGKVLSAAVWPKTGDHEHTSHDYGALGVLVDELKIMLYPGTGPIGALPEMRAFLKYAASRAPRAKLYAAINFYGFDKSSAGQVAITESQGDTLANQRGVQAAFQPTAGELYFTYTDSKGPHQVWYVNGQAIAKKCDLAAELGLAGIAIWQLGGEKADIWAAIKSARWSAASS